MICLGEFIKEKGRTVLEKITASVPTIGKGRPEEGV